MTPGAGTYTVTVTDSDGCTGVTTGTVYENPVCVITPPDPEPDCGSSGNQLTVAGQGGGGGYSYAWELVSSPAGWSITSATNLATITYDAGEECIDDQQAYFRVTVTDANQCTSTCEVRFCCILGGDVFCTLTQGYYGNEGGNQCLDGELVSTIELLDYLIPGGDPLVIGKPGRSFTIPDGAEQCIIDRLPGGGPPQALPDIGDDVFSYPSCDTDPPLPQHNRSGRWRNVLLAQTVTLALNLRWDDAMGSHLYNLDLCKYITTAEIDDNGTPCDISDDTPTGIPTTYVVPASVIAQLGLNKSVADLLELANCALAGQDVGITNLADIAAALGAINDGFDECRFLVTCSNTPPVDFVDVQERGTSDDWWWSTSGAQMGAMPKAFGLLPAFPNPVRATSTKIRFALPEASKVQLMVFDVTGRVVATLADGTMDAGYQEADLNINQHRMARGMYFYRMEAVGIESGERFVKTQKMVVLQ